MFHACNWAQEGPRTKDFEPIRDCFCTFVNSRGNITCRSQSLAGPPLHQRANLAGFWLNDADLTLHRLPWRIRIRFSKGYLLVADDVNDCCKEECNLSRQSRRLWLLGLVTWCGQR